eukprot:scaffold3084_cov144-Cylindrotheca_fusiformis.AAC.33
MMMARAIDHLATLSLQTSNNSSQPYGGTTVRTFPVPRLLCGFATMPQMRQVLQLRWSQKHVYVRLSPEIKKSGVLFVP